LFSAAAPVAHCFIIMMLIVEAITMILVMMMPVVTSTVEVVVEIVVATTFTTMRTKSLGHLNQNEGRDHEVVPVDLEDGPADH
jgi:type IV secretory pathway component VirB8